MRSARKKNRGLKMVIIEGKIRNKTREEKKKRVDFTCGLARTL